MPTHNIWLGLSDDMQAELAAYVRDDTPPVQFPLISNMDPLTKAWFNNVYDGETVSRLFKTWNANSRNYRVWSVYFIKPDPADIVVIRGDIDALTATYGQDFSIMGAWRFDNGSNMGGDATPTYPNPPQLINFIPPTWDHNDDPPTEIPATALSDVNLLAGQAPRVFV